MLPCMPQDCFCDCRPPLLYKWPEAAAGHKLAMAERDIAKLDLINSFNTSYEAFA